MKKINIFYLLITILLLVSFVSCSNPSSSNDNTNDSTKSDTSYAPDLSTFMQDQINISGFQGGYLYVTLQMLNFQTDSEMNVNQNTTTPNEGSHYVYTKTSDTTATLVVSFPFDDNFYVYSATFNLTFTDSKNGTYKGTENVIHKDSKGNILSNTDYILNSTFSLS
jgi:hypothetical protein